MGSCVSQFCQQQDQIVQNNGLNLDTSFKSPQQIYSQANQRLKSDQNRLQKLDDSDGECNEDEMELTQMIMDLKGQGVSQNIQNLMNQRYNMELQSISVIEQAQISFIAKAPNLDMDQEFSNNYFLSEQLVTSNKNQDDSNQYQKINNHGNYMNHMVSSFASGINNNEFSPTTIKPNHIQRSNQKKASAIGINAKKKKRQFLVFRLPRTQYLLPRLSVVPAINAQDIQDIYFLKDLYDLQKIVSSNLIINAPSRRRFSSQNMVSQFYQQNVQEKMKDQYNSLFFQKLKIIMNEVLMSDLSFLSTLEQWSTIQKLSIHIQSSANTDFLGMLLQRFKDVQELNLRFEASFVPVKDFLTANCSLGQLSKLKLVFSNLFFVNNESSRNFYERILCTIIGKAFPENYHNSELASAQSFPTSIGIIVQQQQNQQYLPTFINLTSLKFEFIHTDCSPIIELLLNKVFKGIAMPYLNKLTMKVHTVQDVANYQVQMMSCFYSTCNQLGQYSAINFNSVKSVNFGIIISSMDHMNQDAYTARFNLSQSNQLEDEMFATRASVNFNAFVSITDISPNQVYKTGQYKKQLVDDIQNAQSTLNQNNINQSISSNMPNHRISNFGIEMQSSVNTYNPQMSFNQNSNIGSPMLMASNQDARQLFKNHISGFLKSIDIKKARKIILRDESGINNFNSFLPQMRTAQNIVQINLQFSLTSETQFQSLISVLQQNSNSIKKLQLEIEKKILISIYDDHKLFAIISKMQNLVSLITCYKTKEPVFHQIITAPNLILFCEHKNVFNQSPTKTPARQYTRQHTSQNISSFIKNIGSAKKLLHISSPDFVQILPLQKGQIQNAELKIQDSLLLKLLKQAKKRLAICYLSIHPSLKQFYLSNSQIKSVMECSITLMPSSILQNQFLLDISEFY